MHNASKLSRNQRRRNDNINKICVLEGGGGIEDICAKHCFSWETP